MIIAIDRRDDRLERARYFGATHILNSAEHDPVEYVREVTARRGVEHVFEVVGLPETMGQGLEMLARGGLLTILGGAASNRYQVDATPQNARGDLSVTLTTGPRDDLVVVKLLFATACEVKGRVEEVAGVAHRPAQILLSQAARIRIPERAYDREECVLLSGAFRGEGIDLSDPAALRQRQH
jgi:D-arabinose 1-dehydrogenase-like Zn-dependent alcohol dehydrogenase